ncbi:MAG: glycerol-3-phosphate 1-O-acyltransferase PlsY [Rhodospirillales bacterium]
MPDAGASLALEHQLAGLVGYLLGSIPFGLILTRLFGAGDLRTIGSGNIGATNVLRTGRKSLALATLVLDGGKGALAALLFFALWEPLYGLIAGVFAVVGHNFPIWLKFKGGKGVATTFGVLLAWSWPAGLAVGGVWLAAAVLFRYSSLAAILAALSAPVFIHVFSTPEAVALTVGLSLLCIARHHENIRRLIKGEEPKIGKKADKSPLKAEKTEA